MTKAVSTRFQPEGPDDEAAIEVLHPDSGERNSRQISDLLALRNEARGLLITREEIGVTTNIDADAAADARDVYTAAGHQIRNILDDMSRWGSGPGETERETLRLLETKLHHIKAGREFNDRPCVRYRPRIAQMPIVPDNKLVWVVWLGADEPQKNGPHGIGQTPEEAMLDFDRNWTTPKAPDTLEKPFSPSVAPEIIPDVALPPNEE